MQNIRHQHENTISLKYGTRVLHRAPFAPPPESSRAKGGSRRAQTRAAGSHLFQCFLQIRRI